MSDKNAKRLAIVMADIGMIFLIYTPFSPEPPMIFMMSALALFFSGVIAVIESQKEEK